MRGCSGHRPKPRPFPAALREGFDFRPGQFVTLRVVIDGQETRRSYPARVSLIHLLSRQAQEVELLHGRIDEAKVAGLLRTMLPSCDVDEAFICGSGGEDRCDSERPARRGVPAERIHTERFSAVSQRPAAKAAPRVVATPDIQSTTHRLDVVLDGKTHHLAMGDDAR